MTSKPHSPDSASSQGPAPLDPQYRISRLEADGQRLIELTTREPEAEVPNCPNWKCAKLLKHMVIVWNGAAAQVGQRAQGLVNWREIPLTPPQESLANLCEVLRDIDPSEELWTWGRDKTAEFYFRRLHHETLVHRVDAEQAAGEPTNVLAADATDGIDEFFSLIVYRRQQEFPQGSLHLHPTDSDAEFMVLPADGKVRLTYQHAKGDAAVKGTAADLYLCAWGRATLSGLEVFGDPDLAAQWMALAP